MYIRLFELYLRLGGKAEAVQKDSPIERTLSQYFGRKVCTKRIKANPTTASTLSASELVDSGPLTPDRTTWEYMQGFEDKIDKLAIMRRRLVRALEVVEQVVVREQLKLQNLNSFLD